jgi:hypothetical protein
LLAPWSVIYGNSHFFRWEEQLGAENWYIAGSLAAFAVSVDLTFVFRAHSALNFLTCHGGRHLHFSGRRSESVSDYFLVSKDNSTGLLHCCLWMRLRPQHWGYDIKMFSALQSKAVCLGLC